MGSAALHAVGTPEPTAQFCHFSPETGEVLDAGCRRLVGGVKGGHQGDQTVFHGVGETGRVPRGGCWLLMGPLSSHLRKSLSAIIEFATLPPVWKNETCQECRRVSLQDGVGADVAQIGSASSVHHGCCRVPDVGGTGRDVRTPDAGRSCKPRGRSLLG